MNAKDDSAKLIKDMSSYWSGDAAEIYQKIFEDLTKIADVIDKDVVRKLKAEDMDLNSAWKSDESKLFLKADEELIEDISGKMQTIEDIAGQGQRTD